MAHREKTKDSLTLIMAYCFTTFFIFLYILLLFREAKANWDHIGPDGGGTNISVAIASWHGTEIIFVGNELGGLFRSTDGGETYIPSNGSIKINPTINAIAFDPNSPGVVYCATNLGIYKSTDYGESWVLVLQVKSKSTGSDSSETLGGNRLIVDPGNSNLIYYAANIDGLFKSTDGGNSWQNVQSGDLPDNPCSITIGENGYIYVAVYNHGVYKSMDGGITWEVRNQGIPDKDILTVKASVSNPKIIYAVSYLGGVYKSINGGQTWVAKKNGIDFTGPYDCYRPLVIDYANPDIVYLSAYHYSKVFKTTNGGESWTKSAPFVQEDEQSDGWSKRDMAVGSNNPNLLVLPTGNATFRSTDGGISWYRKQAGIKCGMIVDVDYDENSSAIWIGNFDQGLFNSTDGGKSWSNVAKAFTRGLLIDSSTSPSKIFWSIDTELRKSVDGGLNWYSITSYPGGGHTYYCDMYREIMYATAQDDKVYKSSNSGESWGLTGTQPANGLYAVTAIAVDPVNPDIVYAGTDSPDGGIYKSTDGGNTWDKLLGIDFWTVRSIAVNKLDPREIVVGCEQWSTCWGRIYRSNDSGISFEKVYDQQGMPITRVLFDFDNPGVVYAASGTDNPNKAYSGAVVSSKDGGITWSDITGELPVYGFMSMIKLSKEGSVLVGGYGISLWKINPSPVAYWAMDEGSGSAIYDSTNNGNDGTIYGAIWTTNGKVGLSALEFDGSGDYVLIPERGMFDFATEFSISAWINYRPGRGIMGVVGKNRGTYQFLIGSNRNRLILTLNSTIVVLGNPNTLTPNTWHHVACTYNDKVGARTYIDGKLDKENVSFKQVLNASSEPLMIGVTNNNKLANFFSGVIDEVRIYDKAISEEQIAEDYKQGI